MGVHTLAGHDSSRVQVFLLISYLCSVEVRHERGQEAEILRYIRVRHHH